MKWKLGDLYLGKEQYRSFKGYLYALGDCAVELYQGLKQVGWNLFSIGFSIVVFPLFYVVGFVYTNFIKKGK